VVKVKVAEPVPAPLIAVTVYVVAGMTSVGVPESKPVELLKLMPAGNVPVRL